jgi:glycosyltransferase involved in cell wall biosynthesis
MFIGLDISRLAVVARTGTEHYTWELLRALAHLDRRNRYRLYYNQAPAHLPSLPDNFTLRSIPLPRLWTHARLSWEMATQPPDVLFVPAHALPLGNAPRSVVTIHDLGFVRHPEAHTFAQRMYHRVFTRLSARRATRVIAISQTTKRDLQDVYRISPDKIDVVYHGVDPRFKPIEDRSVVEEVLRRYDLAPPYLLFVSTIQPRKNVGRLIEAFARARRVLGDRRLKLVLAGKRGWLTEQIERRAGDLGISDAVRFLGYVADEDLPALLNAASAYVIPSLYEGFGMTVLEAQACGTPVLASNVSALPEVVGDAGLLVDPYNVAVIANGIVQLASDAVLRDRLRERGLRHAAGWTWKRTAHETLAVLETAGRSR